MASIDARMKKRRRDSIRVGNWNSGRNVPRPNNHWKSETILSALIIRLLEIAEAYSHSLAGVKICHRSGKHVWTLLFHQTCLLTLLPRLDVLLFRLVPFFDDAANDAFADAHLHSGHRRLARQRKNVDRFQRILTVVHKGLRNFAF